MSDPISAGSVERITSNEKKRSTEYLTDDSEKGEDPEFGSYDDHVFSNPLVAAHWEGVYEKARYEGRHRFDPTFRWTAEEEKRVQRKIDLRIITWAWAMFMALDINRRNINRGEFLYS